MAYAIVTPKSAKFSDDFARDWIARVFGPEAVDHIFKALPIITRGKNAGKPKGTLKWWKAETAGFAREVQQGVRPGTIRIELWTGDAGERDVCFGCIVCGRNVRDDGGLDLPRLYAAGGRSAAPKAA